ncbi:FtsW/RodA/SpoVE family cell cycle protein [Lacrimispora sp. 210928-DFI.3.58]|uniref:FtsW/RodA/SpoVE family cell cycle protein n=1 Tax=Lacrimispora sp. 210928-DFI.3.58 TaxID=2883214 RepID=UPI001D06D581|nr:FtsW/RodA/SpoVE family cell cycle protein [Lacrimispora sp. 210928-DFI.3.58]
MKKRMLFIPVALTFGGIFFLYHMNNTIEIFGPAYFAERQGAGMVLGLFLALLISRIDYHLVAKISPWILLACICLIRAGEYGFAPVHTGRDNMWLQIGQIDQLRVSFRELIMTTACAMTAKLAVRKKGERVGWDFLIQYMLVAYAFVLLHSLYGFMMYTFMVCAILFIKCPKLAGAVFTGILILGVMIILDSYEMREDSFLGMAQESVYAMASGGWFGIGLGSQTAAFHMDEMQSSFIMSGIVREIGWLGVSSVLLIYLAFFWDGVMIAFKAADRLGFYLAAAIMVTYMIRLGLNLLISVDLIPYTPVSIPFISYGASVLLNDFILVGILLSISRNSPEPAGR